MRVRDYTYLTCFYSSFVSLSSLFFFSFFLFFFHFLFILLFPIVFLHVQVFLNRIISFSLLLKHSNRFPNKHLTQYFLNFDLLDHDHLNRLKPVIVDCGEVYIDIVILIKRFNFVSYRWYLSAISYLNIHVSSLGKLCVLGLLALFLLILIFLFFFGNFFYSFFYFLFFIACKSWV